MARRLSMRQAGELALAEVSDLVGCPGEGVTGVRTTEFGWVVTVEILEMGRIPETADVLATYDVQVSDEGEVTDFRRIRRYMRSQVDVS